jgi:hypothetical protein
MPVLTLPFLGTLATIVVTAVAFVLLTRRSAGGPVPWSIAAGLARGVGAWSRQDPGPFNWISPRSQDPAPPIDTTRLPLPPLEGQRRRPEDSAVPGADPEFLAGAEIEELGSRRL